MQGENSMSQAFYTVATDRKGFPIYFLCPSCLELHSFPEEPDEACFNDPGEASSFFKVAFSVLADWTYLSPTELVMHIKVVRILLWNL
jgi:hypothetical protein